MTEQRDANLLFENFLHKEVPEDAEHTDADGNYSRIWDLADGDYLVNFGESIVVTGWAAEGEDGEELHPVGDFPKWLELFKAED